MIKLKHLLTEQINFVSKRRARAELNQKIKGKRADDMGAYTGKIFGLEQEDQNAPRTELTRIEDLAKYSAFALGNANTPEIGNVGSVLKFKMPRKRAGLFFAPANLEYIDYKIDYEDDDLDDEGKPETAYIKVDAEYAEAAKKILNYMAPGVYELITGDDEKGDKEESVLKAIETLKNVKYGVERREAMEIVLAAAEAIRGQKARTYKQALQMLDLEEPINEGATTDQVISVLRQMKEDDAREMLMMALEKGYLTADKVIQIARDTGGLALNETTEQYPSFKCDRNIKYQDKNITKGYWT